MSDVKDAEIVPEVALAKVDPFGGLVKENERPVVSMVEAFDNLDWRNMKPHHMAMLLMQKPFPVTGGGTTRLTFNQAIFFATRCYELGVSPFSNEVWFDTSRFSVNLTLEGKRAVARNKGIDLGPPKFEPLSRPWTDVPKITEAGDAAKKAGFAKDVGYKCTIRVGDPRYAETTDYTAWLSEWYVSRSPVWQAKPEHMLQIRSQEKAISMAMGTGASAFPDERELG